MQYNHIFQYRLPDFTDIHGGEYLLVWGELAQWLMVDQDVPKFLAYFDGPRTLGEVIALFAQETQAPPAAVEQDVCPMMEELLRRGILHSPGAPPLENADELKIANVTMNLTNRCNLRCRWCYNSNRVTEELPIEVLMDAIAMGKSVYSPDASFILLGGEPFIDPPRLVASLERARDIFTAPTLVSTNGTLLSGDMIQKLACYPIEIQVSVDGGRRETHERVRGPETFDRTIENVRRLTASGIYTILSMVYVKDSEPELEPFFDLALELGVQEARLIPLRAIGRGLDFSDNLPRQDRIFEALMSLLGRRPEIARLLGRDFFSILAAVCSQSQRRLHCGVGRNVVFIDSDGALYPCPNHVGPEYRCGHIPEDTIEGVLLSSPVMCAMRKRYCVALYECCRKCAFRHWCAGDCRGETVSLSGNPHAPSRHCGELQKIIPSMLWMIARGTLPLPMSRRPIQL